LIFEVENVHNFASVLDLNPDHLTPQAIESAYHPYLNQRDKTKIIEASIARAECYVHLLAHEVTRLRSSKFRFKLPFDDRCEMCRGRGFFYHVEPVAYTCNACNGTGLYTKRCNDCFDGVYFVRPTRGKNKGKEIPKTCRRCTQGVIRDKKRKCLSCRGKGSKLLPASLGTYEYCTSCKVAPGSGRGKEKTGNVVISPEVGKQLLAEFNP